ncbi:MAG: VanW family protein [Chloroflexi bacterium]|nr:VanW family protein [Chloroflexota bacterium]
MTTIDTAPSATATAARRVPRVRAVLVAFGAGVVLAALLAAAGLYAYDRAYLGRVLPGVRVGGVDLSGLDRTAAARRLDEAFAAMGNGTVTLSGGTASETLSYAELGRRVDVAGLLERGFAVGRSGSILDRALDDVRTAVSGADIAPAVTVDVGAIERDVAAVAGREDRPAVDASAVPASAGFTTTPAVAGSAVDRAAAVAAIEAALVDPKAPPDVHVALTMTTVSPAVTDDAANTARAQAAAMAQDLVVAAGSETWTLSGDTIRTWIRFAGTAGSYGPIVDMPDLTTALGPFATRIARTPKDAAFLVGKGGLVVGVTAAVVGRRLDVNGTAAAVAAALAGRAAGTLPPSETVAAALSLSQPKLSTATAAQSAPLMKQISTWTTYYIPGAHNGNSANITIPALAISGTVVAPREWFSFWKSVGDVTLAKGYTLGGAIIDGKSVEGKTIGGGICSTSTTLFNAALRAGFEMGARENHYYYISRYPVGLDATVFINDAGVAQDMTWRNDTPYPVLIKASTRPGVVTFVLYSVPTGRQVTFTQPIIKNYQPSTTITQETTSLPPGQREQVEYEAAGFDAWVTRTVRDASGAVVHDDTFQSHYARVVGLILVGAAKPPA